MTESVQKVAYTAAVITVSDRGAAGEREDASGPALVALLAGRGYDVVRTAIVPDERTDIERELRSCAEADVALVLTTGGTGFSPRDVTPEATAAVCERMAPGIPEAMRAASMQITDRACLSREAAGICGRTLVVNLPGSAWPAHPARRAGRLRGGGVARGRHSFRLRNSMVVVPFP